MSQDNHKSNRKNTNNTDNRKTDNNSTNQLSAKQILFIGGGNMAQALLSGLLGRDINPKNIAVCDPSTDVKTQLEHRGVKVVLPSSEAAYDAIKAADILLLAVKPQVMKDVVADFASLLSQQLIISVAAGLTTQSLSQMLGGYNTIVRAMPNTPAMIQMGATGLYADAHISDEQRKLANEVMTASGLTIWVDKQDDLHAVTAVSGSAPAYVFYFIESIIQGGINLGLDKKQATALAMQTVLGAAQMSITSQEEPSELRRKVTSPNGTTQAALESMQANNVGEHIQQAMQACYQRSQEISEQMGK